MNRIYTRREWGARYVDGVATRTVGSLQKYLHHSVTPHLPKNATVAQEKVQARYVERIGQERFGRGISYTWLIFPSGRIYQGASVHRVSYHSGGGRDGKPRNTLGVGICLVGNYEANPVTPEQEDALVWLLRHGVAMGWWQDPAITEGHRDFKQTSCPGRHAYDLIPKINRLARSGQATIPQQTGDDSMATHWAFEAERADGNGVSWYVQNARAGTFEYISTMGRKATLERVRSSSFPGDQVRDWSERPGGGGNRVDDAASMGVYVGDPTHAPAGVYVG